MANHEDAVGAPWSDYDSLACEGTEADDYPTQRRQAEEMLEQAGVLAAPGSDFCPNTGQHYIRFSYAGATEQIAAAVHRISRWRGGA